MTEDKEGTVVFSIRKVPISDKVRFDMFKAKWQVTGPVVFKKMLDIVEKHEEDEKEDKP